MNNDLFVMTTLVILAAFYVINKGFKIMQQTSPSWYEKSQQTKYYLQDYKMLTKYYGMGYILAALGIITLLLLQVNASVAILSIGIVLVILGYMLSSWAHKALE